MMLLSSPISNMLFFVLKMLFCWLEFNPSRMYTANVAFYACNVVIFSIFLSPNLGNAFVIASTSIKTLILSKGLPWMWIWSLHDDVFQRYSINFNLCFQTFRFRFIQQNNF